ncbi:MAG: hypothetical protein ACE5PV_20655 [Candidatus Poribacteria bacterium]
MNDKRNEWERQFLKVLTPIIENEKEMTRKPGVIPETIDEFICRVNHVEGDVAYLRLRGEKNGELRDFGLEYPLRELRAQIGEASAGMMLKCQVQDNLHDVVLHFERFTPQKLPLERRKTLQEEYNKMFEDFDEEEPLEIVETT